MRRLFCLCLVGVLGILSVTGLGADPTPVQAHGRLSVRGLQLVDQLGNPVQLRGFSTYNIAGFSWLFNPDTLKELVTDFKADVLRIVMYTDPYEAGYVNHDGSINKGLRDTVEDLIQMTGDAGLYCIVDWHNMKEGDPNKYLKESKDFFGYLAQKYGNDPHVLFELCNEPNGAATTWKDKVRPYSVEVLGEVRKYAPDTVCLIGTPTYDQDVDLAAQDPIPGKNLLYVFHFYAGTHGAELRRKVTEASKNLPLFCSEWGTTEASGDGRTFPAETRAWHDFLDAHGYSSCNWSLSTAHEGSAALKVSYNPNDDDPGKMIDNLTDSGKLALEMLLRPKR